MNYRSITDLSYTIRTNLHKLPRDIDLIVGVPRSGMLAANIIALNLNLKFCDLGSFIDDTPLMNGRIRKTRYEFMRPSEAKHVLVVDDSIDSGDSMREVKEKLFVLGGRNKISYCAIYLTQNAQDKVNIFFDICHQPRVFEWNVMHRSCLLNYCLDIDGVLCIDPTDKQNDDGSAYLNFLKNALPLVLPTYPIGHLVTSRLEKYRKETELWLYNHGVVYNKLHMLDLPDAETRRRLGCHAAFKAKVFRNEYETTLFVESDPNQARQIAQESGKYALSFSTQELFSPNFSYAVVENKSRHFTYRLCRKIFRAAKHFIG